MFMTNGTGVGCLGAARRGAGEERGGEVFRTGERCGDLARLRLRLRLARSMSIGTMSSVSMSLYCAEDWREMAAMGERVSESVWMILSFVTRDADVEERRLGRLLFYDDDNSPTYASRSRPPDPTTQHTRHVHVHEPREDIV